MRYATIDGFGAAPPLRLLGGAEGRGRRLGLLAKVEHSTRQIRTTGFDTATTAFSLVDLSADRTPLPGRDLRLTLNAGNEFRVPVEGKP